MRSPIALAALVAGLSLSGCATPAPRPDLSAADAEAPAGSLFPADAAVLPDDAIARILAHQWSAPAKARVAVLRVGQRSPFYRWSDEFARLEGQLREELLGALRGSARVSAAAELPSLLVPRDQTVGHLREAAARFRAELLIAWRADCRSYERFRLFSRDEAKAHCDVEAVLLDVRSNRPVRGIVQPRLRHEAGGRRAVRGGVVPARRDARHGRGAPGRRARGARVPGRPGAGADTLTCRAARRRPRPPLHRRRATSPRRAPCRSPAPARSPARAACT